MQPSKLKMVQRFKDEKAFRESLLLPLFERLGYLTVHNHGVSEFGKDIVISKTNDFGIREYTGLVVKKGNVNVGAKKETAGLYDIARQVSEAFNIKYLDEVEKKEVTLDKSLVVCDGKISDNAKRTIVEQWGNSRELFEKNTTFISGEKLVEIITNNWPIFFESNSPEFYEFYKSLIDYLDKEEKVRAVNIDDSLHKLTKRYIKCSIVEFHKTRGGKYKPIPRNADTVFDETKRILMVGESGTGKSHILREQIKRLLNNEFEDECPPRLKVYLKLSEFSDTCITSACVEDIVSDFVEKVWPNAPKGYAANFIDEKRVDFYLDGYDEIPTEEKRKVARENIIYLISEFNNSQFAITTREMSAIFNQEFPESFKRFNLTQIDYKQAVEFLESIVKKSSKNGGEVLKQIKQQEILLVLPRTPMTVQLVTSLFSENASKEIPSNTTEIYKIFTELMLGRWDKQRDVTNIYDYEQKVTLLSEIALFMQQSLYDYILYEKAIEISENFLGSYGDDKEKGKKLLDEIITRSELLLVDNGNLRFKHRSFQEYFSAYKIQTQGIDFKEFASHVSDPWWDNVITFLCGFRKNADDILEYVAGLDKPDEIDEDLFKFRRGKNLGLYVRAGYQSNNDKKKIALQKSLEDFDYCFETDALAERIKEIIKRKPGKKNIHIALQLILSHAYYSKLTQKVIFDSIDEVEPRMLSYMVKLIADYKDNDLFNLAVEKVNSDNNIEVKQACAIVCEEFSRGDDVKLLESKEFRKLKKSANIIIKKPQKKIH